jgi:alcohol dehydrogenase
VQAYRLLDEYIPRLLEEPEDGAVRMQLMAAGYLLNRAADIEPLGGGARARLSSLSATGAPINTRYQCGQGACSAVLTPATLRYSLETAQPELAALGRAMATASAETPEPEAARAAVDAVAAFFRDTGMPSRLRDIGVPRDEIELIAEDTMGSFFLRHDGRTEEHRRELIEMLNEVW